MRLLTFMNRCGWCGEREPDTPEGKKLLDILAVQTGPRCTFCQMVGGQKVNERLLLMLEAVYMVNVPDEAESRP